MKRILAALSAGALFTLLIPAGIASAHVLKVDGDIGAVLHINPDDNPVSGTPTDYVMSFDDDTGKFSLPDCLCDVSILQGATTLGTKPLVITNKEVSENKFTFPKPDVYTMRFTGRPKQPGDFQSFTLDYTVRVTGGSAGTQPFPLLLWIGMGLGMGLILLAAFATEYTETQ